MCAYTHPAVLCPLFGAVEEEGAEDGDPHAVTEHCQVRLGELKCRWVLIQQLPHTVQEQQEQRRLATGRMERERKEEEREEEEGAREREEEEEGAREREELKEGEERQKRVECLG